MRRPWHETRRLPGLRGRGIRGQFSDSRQQERASFTHRPPDAWCCMFDEASGVMTDGRINRVIDHGIAVVVATVAPHRQVHLSDHLCGLLDPRRLELGDILQPGGPEPIGAVVAGREAWTLQVLPSPQRWPVPVELALDADTGILLRVVSGDDRYELTDVELAHGLRDELFQWQGPVDLDRRPGVVSIADSPENFEAWAAGDPSTPVWWDAHWEVNLPAGLVYSEDGPRGTTDVDAAIAWGQVRARTVLVRAGVSGTYYSAGEADPDEPLPRWPPN